MNKFIHAEKNESHEKLFTLFIKKITRRDTESYEKQFTIKSGQLYIKAILQYKFYPSQIPHAIPNSSTTRQM